mmetsp:Transcript_1966/g.5531  ORF Transcript_1966/g.5531 Transcript_1966/m.5531 type:complete len:251 (-) Transcript_1966:1658-2410(-)
MPAAQSLQLRVACGPVRLLVRPRAAGPRAEQGGSAGLRVVPAASTTSATLHGPLDELLHALEAVLVLVLVGARLGPLRRWGRRAAEAADHVDRRDVGRRGLEELHASGEADVAFAELHALVEAKHLEKSVPPRLRHRKHCLGDDLAAAQPGEANHVLIARHVGATQLGDKQVGQEDDTRDNIYQNPDQRERAVVQKIVAPPRKHREGHLVQVQGGHGDALEVLADLFQRANGAREGSNEERQAEQEQTHL